jgi:hypothetical protein
MKYIKRNVKRIELFVEIVFLIALFLLGLFFDYRYAVSLFWQFYLFMAVLALFLLLPIYLESRRKRELWLFLGFNISVLALHFLPLTPAKPFAKFYLDIKNGMTVQEVQGLFNQNFPKGGIFRQPEWSIININYPISDRLNGKSFVDQADRNLHYILDPTDDRYRGEFVTVYFKDGKVVARYCSD